MNLIYCMNSKIFLKLRMYLICSALIIFFAGSSYDAVATHAAGAELTYRCLGGMQYELIATFYRDCGGTPEPNTVTIKYSSSSCAYSRMVIATKVPGLNGEEVTMPCATSASSCNGGFTTGLRKWVYKAVVTLPFACNDWVISYRVCCRNCTVTTIQSPCASGSELYVEAVLNNIDAPCNNSPIYNNDPVVFICAGQNFNFNQGVYDVDGDSLAYELITPKISADDVVSFIPPMSTQSPLLSSTPFSVNQITGDINFTPSSIQIGIIALRINEYRNGQFIGSTIRDMQVYTQNCFNSVPSASGIDSSAFYNKTVCAGEILCFNIYTTDIDNNQIVSVDYDNLPSGATITETGGSRPQLQFCWTPTESDISSNPKIFTLTVRDDACPLNAIQTYSYSILVSGPQLNVITTEPDCVNPNSGTATVSGSGISGGTIIWNTIPQQNTQTATGLTSGLYQVVVTDINGCSAMESAVISPTPNTLVTDATGSGLISCQSGNIGEGTVSASGGIQPYSFEWSNGSTSQSISGLSSGIYTVTVTDAIGCVSEDTIHVLELNNDLSLALASVNNIKCYGDSTGAVELLINGGESPFTYIWNTGATSSIVSQLTAGIYTATVTDGNGCSKSSTINLIQPANQLQSGVLGYNNVNCFNDSTGEIVLNVTGGTSPYNYNWSNGAIGFINSGLIAGNYTAVVTDANGCVDSVSHIILQPSDSVAVELISKSDVLCFGSSDGTIEVTASGGSGSYTYLWNTGFSSNVISGLFAGNYIVNVTDMNGCNSELHIPITQPVSPLISTVDLVEHADCNQATGQVQISTEGGTQPYSFTWSNGLSTPNLSGVQPGTYALTTTDKNGCTVLLNVEILNQSSVINLSQDSLQNITCKGLSNGYIKLHVSGGNGPYVYSWSNGATGNFINNLSAGVYSVTVTDSFGCSVNDTFSIVEPDSSLIIEEINHKDMLCYGDNDGQIIIKVSGGTAPYSYLWSNGNSGFAGNNLTAGNYTITVTDLNGCASEINSEIIQPENAVSGSVTIINQLSCNGNDGSAVAIGAGGTGSLNYIWSNGETGPDLSNVGAGVYTVTITDQVGCTYQETVSFQETAAAITISGNVVQGDCQIGTGSEINIEVYGGIPPFSFVWSNGETTQNINNLLPGTYQVTITDASGCTSSESFVVSNTSELNVITSGSDTICSGDLTTLTVDSIIGATYQWYFNGNILNGATGTSFTTPAEGFYTVNVTNGCGTFESDTILVVVKSIGNVSVSNQQIICPPETATLVATGGLKYHWTPTTYITFTNVPDPIVSPLTTTTYTVDIMNEYGCKTSLSTVVAVVCDTLLVPTGFSPNDDGTNDGYVIEGIEDYPGNKLWVYNRWGKLVYKATDYMNSWDGVSNISGVFEGRKVPVGTYYYILDLNDRSKPRSGYLIIRH